MAKSANGIWSKNPTPEALEALRAYHRNYQAGRKDKQRDYYQKNAEKIKAASRACQAAIPKKRVKLTPEESASARRARALRWYYKNRSNRTPEQIARTNECARVRHQRKKNLPHYFSSRLCRARIHSVLRQRGAVKSQRTHSLIGCSPLFLRQYIESLFQVGMTWENYGTAWEIDHKRPCALFDLFEESEQRACFHYTNLQPLRCVENRKKGKKYG